MDTLNVRSEVGGTLGPVGWSGDVFGVGADSGRVICSGWVIGRGMNSSGLDCQRFTRYDLWSKGPLIHIHLYSRTKTGP